MTNQTASRTDIGGGRLSRYVRKPWTAPQGNISKEATHGRPQMYRTMRAGAKVVGWAFTVRIKRRSDASAPAVSASCGTVGTNRWTRALASMYGAGRGGRLTPAASAVSRLCSWRRPAKKSHSAPATASGTAGGAAMVTSNRRPKKEAWMSRAKTTSGKEDVVVMADVHVCTTFRKAGLCPCLLSAQTGGKLSGTYMTRGR